MTSGVKRQGQRSLGMKYIKRQETSRSQGWRVTFLARHKAGSRYWADLKYGGRKEALAQAIAWRDAMMRRYSIPRTRRRLPVPWNGRGTTGIRGVHLNNRKRAFIVQIAEAPHHYPRAYFGFATHGSKRKALIAAVRYRVKNEIRLYGTIVSPLPAWLAAEVGTAASLKRST